MDSVIGLLVCVALLGYLIGRDAATGEVLHGPRVRALNDLSS
jgi:hypothetical protein